MPIFDRSQVPNAHVMGALKSEYPLRGPCDKPEQALLTVAWNI